MTKAMWKEEIEQKVRDEGTRRRWEKEKED